jgi:hypothetical protein
VTNAGGFDLDQHFTLAGAFELNGFDGQGLAWAMGNGSSNIHGQNLL